MRKGVLHLILIMFITLSFIERVRSQSSDDFVKVIARAHPDSIVLRWAPSGPASWKLLTQHGYKVERYTIIRDGQVLQEKPYVVLTNLLKPAAPAQWEIWMERDDFVAVAAQAIYGDDFKVDPDKSNLMDIYNKVRELESRYSFNLFAADISVKAAELSALRWVDKEVKENEMYLYVVSSLVPFDLLTIEAGNAYTGPSKSGPLPIPFKPEVESVAENKILIRWETSALKDIYTSYYLERSEDEGKTFTKVNDVPMTILEPAVNKDGITFSSRSDTLVVGRKVHYRIRGWNSFGEEGPPSEELIFTGELNFTVNPVITKTEVFENEHIKIQWDFPMRDKQDLKGFEIERSANVDTDYEVINSDLIRGEGNEFLDRQPFATNYYRVVAVSNKGMRNISFSHLVQLEDSIPPVAPSGLTASIDSIGLVNLKWLKNTETDLIGYRVFKSAFKNAEFGQVTISPQEGEEFIDTVNIKTLTRTMYYKITAVDNRFNTSEFSEVFEVILPDIIPPIPPVIKNIHVSKKGVELEWIKSSSEDVVSHQILRKDKDTETWITLKQILKKDTTTIFLDSLSVKSGSHYAMVAIDENGLRSIMTKPLWAKSIPADRNKIDKVKAKANRQDKSIVVSWMFESPEVTKVLIYRSTEETPITLYKSVTAPAKQFVDTSLTMDTIYKYRIKAVFDDGTESFFSDEVVIKY